MLSKVINSFHIFIANSSVVWGSGPIRSYIHYTQSDCNKFHCIAVMLHYNNIMINWLSPPTSEAGVRFLAWSQVGKLVVGCLWLAVYSTEPDELYVLVSSVLPTTRCDMTCTVLKAM